MKRAFQFKDFLHPRKDTESGQVAVESAIILPLMVFMILGIVQLTMMHQAKLMVEYAAFNACRAGIVHNMDKKRMTQAALISLMPTFAATDSIFGVDDPELGRRPGILETWAKLKLVSEGSTTLGQIFGDLGVDANVDLIRIEIINPKAEMFGNKEEIDFDDFHATGSNWQENNRHLRNATRLTIRLRYLYRMQIPFANWIIHMAWLANEAGVRLSGPIDRPEGGALGGVVKLKGQERDLAIAAGLAVQGGDEEEPDTGLFLSLWAIGEQADMYFIPLYATYSMRMQSNPYRKNL